MSSAKKQKKKNLDLIPMYTIFNTFLLTSAILATLHLSSVILLTYNL